MQHSNGLPAGVHLKHKDMEGLTVVVVVVMVVVTMEAVTMVVVVVVMVVVEAFTPVSLPSSSPL